VSKPSIPKGVRDFGPEKMVKRNYIFQTIKTVFQKFGFLPIETPTMENLSVLTGKYGDEGDQLIFKVLNSGDYLSKVDASDIASGYKKMTPKIAEKGLRYDLTVPFARFVVMNRNEITFPFKRFQIQPVWRADRPQKGRYREFYQCDADVVGTNSLLCEAEIVLMIDEVLTNLKIDDFTIKINNRKILTGIAEAIGEFGKEAVICVAIDKLDKIGEDGVIKELQENGIAEEAINKLMPIIALKGNNLEKIAQLRNILINTPTGLLGLEELNKVFDYLSVFEIQQATIEFDIALARGLSYYTGCIFEVKANGVQMGSISGGGRYDNLTGMFGLPDVSGVGFSFGVDRIYDVLEELQLFPNDQQTTTKVLIATFDETAEKLGLTLLQKLRQSGVNSELYPETAKIKKQMSYADSKKIPFVVLIGSDEVTSQLLTLKNMVSGEQQKMGIDEIVAYFN
jgi:histidyl-tRNA synthetase